MECGIVLNEEQRMMVEKNLRLICFALKRIDVKSIGGWDDAYQIGAIGLMKAAARYDEQRNTAFSTFAMTCILNELRMEFRHANRMSNRAMLISLDDFIPGIDNGSLTLTDMIADKGVPLDARLVYRDTRETVLKAVSKSCDRQAARLLSMMLDGRRQEDMAAELGCSQSYVSRRQKTLRQAIRKALQEDMA